MSGRRFVALAVAGLVGFVLVLREIDEETRGPRGPVSSSFATSPKGLGAWADLLRRRGQRVVRLRDRPADAELDTRSTVVLLDPRFVSRDDARALRRFVRGGGRLVVGGAEQVPWWSGLLLADAAPRWDASGPATAAPLVPVPEVAGVGRVRTAGDGRWNDASSALPALAGRSGSLLLVSASGSGRLALLADASPLQNRLLAETDNAALALALAGSRTVVFVESVHGYGRPTGIRAIPTRWKWALAGLVLAALAWMLAAGRRLGPPEREGRPLPPPRREYVDSLATLLAKTRRRADAIEPVRVAAREALARRAGEEDLRAAAARIGLRPDETGALLDRLESDADVLAAGKALAKLAE